MPKSWAVNADVSGCRVGESCSPAGSGMDASGARLVQRERPTKQITAIEPSAMGRNERVGACYSADGAPSCSMEMWHAS